MSDRKPRDGDCRDLETITATLEAPAVARIFDHAGVRRRRITAGLTPEQVAAHVRRTKGQIDNLEAGRSLPSVYVLLGLAELFECDPGELFTDRSEPATVAA